ncbi:MULTISPECIES: hypothetical protein [unclassified Nostoc]|jgi:hypothetical protein|uniref:hypothetical protein n=1 Tax=unclassified Nostoc TaxID=2593658 RepID=UPI002AD29DF8|nr:hypothetical protein [Nostoc sp. DedQUE03]MDZ7971764.1 hypothetical protein [Nostoc sp. DedQUE03]MDZ8049053.1 hypothetical protein [Nostoc sp. DedQUE02]
MSSQPVIDPQILQQLQEEIQQKLGESLQNADLHSVLEKYGFLEDRVLRIHWQCNLDPNQLQSNDAVDEQEPNSLLPVTPKASIPEIVLVKKALCIPCPSTGSPLGCNC